MVRFDDGSRKTWYLPYLWQRTNAKQIQHFIEAVSHLHLSKRIPIDEAVERTKAQAPKGALPNNRTNPDTILTAWVQYGEFKIAVAESVISYLEPINEKFNNLGDKEVDEIIRKNLELAKKSAELTISEVEDALGIS